MGVRVKVGFKDSVGVQSGQNFPWGTFGVHGALGAFGAHVRLRATPLATNRWPEAPRGGGELASKEPRSRPPPFPGLTGCKICADGKTPGEGCMRVDEFKTLIGR